MFFVDLTSSRYYKKKISTKRSPQELFTKQTIKLKLYISALTFANTYYIFVKYYSSSETKKYYQNLKVLKSFTYR